MCPNSEIPQQQDTADLSGGILFTFPATKGNGKSNGKTGTESDANGDAVQRHTYRRPGTRPHTDA
jgi:hypothetical protein